MVFRSTGLKRPQLAPDVAERIPPGQFLTQRWPILHYGPVPSFDPASWDLHIYGQVENELRFSWEEFLTLPRIVVNSDMHCVTRWSKLDNEWEGVSTRFVVEAAGVKPEARHVLFHCEGGYTSNVPIEVFSDQDVILALKHDGEDLTPEHGFPLRVVIPKRYAWKSAKWLRGIEFLAEDRPGFWEQYGYNNNADFSKEERFAD
jgi:DMSO/TMAO reductase YedYZ molybdopterin-dependent catalytic subunit